MSPWCKRGWLPALVLVAAAVLCASGQDVVGRARHMIGDGQRREGIDLLRAFVRQDPGNFDAILLLGTALALEGVRGESVSHLVDAVRLRPDSALGFYTLGIALSRFGEPLDARAALERAVELDPRAADARVNLALVLAQLGELSAAADHLGVAIDMLGDTAAAAYPLRLRANVRMAQYQADKAADDLETAVRLRRDYSEAWTALGEVRRELVQNDAAIRALERAVALDPQDRRARSLLGTLYVHEGRAREAVEHLRAVLDGDSENRAALYQLQRALLEIGQAEEAARIRGRLSELIANGRNAELMTEKAGTLNNEGTELAKSGNHAAALEKYRAALEIDPTHTGFRLNYCLSLCGLDRWGQAVVELKELLRLDPGNIEATRALYIALDRYEEANRKTRNAGP